MLIHPPPGDDFLFGVFQYSLASNAVYVRTGAYVTALSASPFILMPDDVRPSVSTSTLSFELTEPANVELLVQDATTGQPVARHSYPGLAAGSRTVTWDGRGDDGVLLAPGRYRLGLTATDARGFRSPTVYTLQRIFY